MLSVRGCGRGSPGCDAALGPASGHCSPGPDGAAGSGGGNGALAVGRVVQRHILYLGEINSTQELAWQRSIEVIETGTAQPRTLSLFPEGSLRRPAAGLLNRPTEAVTHPAAAAAAMGCLLAGAGTVAGAGVRPVRAERLDPSRTCWDQVLFVRVAYRLLAPGSEWRLHREWFERTALADLLGEDGGLAESHKLYRCHDRLLEHKPAVFTHLTARRRDLFNVSFDVLLYDRSSTYFESDPPFPEADKRRYGPSRDHRSDCAGNHRAGGDGRAAARLRGAAGQHQRRHDAARFPRPHRAAIRQGATHLADGPRRADRSGAG